MPHIQSGDSRRDADAFAAKTSALMRSLGLQDPRPHRDRDQFPGLTLTTLAMESATARGEPRPARDVAVANEIRAWRQYGTSDFADLMLNIADVQLQMGHGEAPTVYQFLTRPSSVPNLSRAGRAGMSGLTIEKTNERSEFKTPSRSDRLAYITAETFGAIIGISRELQEGDDPGAFGRLARDAGRAYALTKEFTFLDALTASSGAGPVMTEDSIALFDTATHGNYVSSGGGAPTVTTVGSAIAAMRTRTDATTTKAQNITPRFVLVPGAHEAQARVLAASWNTALGDQDGDLKVLVSGYLDSKSATRWYLFASPERFDVWEIAYLDGYELPTLESQRSFTTEAMELRVRGDFGVAALDWRTQYANAGA